MTRCKQVVSDPPHYLRSRQCERKVYHGSEYCWQHRPASEKKAKGNKRALVALQYRVMLIGPDGAEWEWRVTDNYFTRRMKKIEAEMLETIREHDLSYEFTLADEDEYEMTRCRFCDAPSTRTHGQLHRVGCTRPRENEA